MAPRTRRPKAKLTAHGILDLRPGLDRVERQGGKAYVVDGEGHYAPVEVEGDVMPPEFATNIEALSELEAARMFDAIRRTPFLSSEGKRERMVVLLGSGKVRLSFEVASGPRRAARPRS